MVCRFLILLAIGGCKQPQRPDVHALDEFRALDRVTTQRFTELVRDYDRGLLDDWELPTRVQRDVIAPWAAWRGRFEAAPVPESTTELYIAVKRYADERAEEWDELVAMHAFGGDASQHVPRYRAASDRADTDARLVATMLADLALSPLPAVAPDAGIAFDPPPFAPPGLAYLLVGHHVLSLDATGTHEIATEVSYMDVLPDGSLWACGAWRAVHWDGTHTTAMKPIVYAESACASGPDGSLWLYERGTNLLAHYTGNTWTTVRAPIPGRGEIEQLVTDKDGLLYALVRDHHGSGDAVFVYATSWTKVPLASSTGSCEHLFRGGDGNLWLIYVVTHGEDHPLALARLTPTGSQPPVFIDDHFQASWLFASVDVRGTATIDDLRRSVLVQDGKTLRLPAHAARGGDPRRGPGPFAIDAAGRTWIDLADGLEVIEREGHRTVFPRASLAGVTEPIRQIAVVGAGPALPAPTAPVTRTITGTVTGAIHAPIILCTDARDPCFPGLPHWDTTTDADGRFTLTNVPRFSAELHIQLGAPAVWRYLRTTCCTQDSDDLGVVAVDPGPQY